MGVRGGGECCMFRVCFLCGLSGSIFLCSELNLTMWTARFVESLCGFYEVFECHRDFVVSENGFHV